MSVDQALIDSSIRNWNIHIERGTKAFDRMTEEQLQLEVSPGRNRVIYILGHLIAIHDALLPLLRISDRLYPELDRPFVSNPDRAVESGLTGNDLKLKWNEVNRALEIGFAGISPKDWTTRHNAVSVEDFEKEPHRHRFSVFLSRSAHLAMHLGQIRLVP